MLGLPRLAVLVMKEPPMLHVAEEGALYCPSELFADDRSTQQMQLFAADTSIQQMRI